MSDDTDKLIKDNDIEMIQQPLMTDDGNFNQACMNELSAAIDNTPKTHQRLSGDPEWSQKKDRWMFRHQIVGAFAMWACRLSPYLVPDGLENVCRYLSACLKTAVDWDSHGMAELSLCDINRLLFEILYEKGIKEFDAWNECKKGNTPDVAFSSRYDGARDPDYDFIDLHALLHQVCLTIRGERRESDKFNREFEEDWAKNKSK